MRMKRTIALLAAIAVSILSIQASAQDKQLFNHAALGVTVGIDGLGAELVMPITPILQIRGGYSFLPFKYDRVVPFDSKDYKGDAIFTGNLWTGGLGNAMLDLYTGRESSFRITAGAFIGSGKLVSLLIDTRDILGPEDYTTAVGWRGATISTDKDGFGHADLVVPKVLPYLGIGFGRSVDPEKRVAFTFDLGAAYTGGIKFTLYDYSNPAVVQSSVVTSDTFIDDNGKALDEGWVDKVSAFPVLPMLKMGLFVRIF